MQHNVANPVFSISNVRRMLGAALIAAPLALWAAHTPEPSSVTVAGSLQSELGCPGDWQPDCAVTQLGYDAGDDAWQGVFNVPAGSWEYKAALDNAWDENYGGNAQQNGPNIPLSLGADTDVKFYYSHETHWITDNVNSIIAVAPGSFQDEIGCAGDWDPGCLRSWLQDPDGDGVFTFTATMPGGDYEAKVAIGESWDENYGDGGVPGGANIPFSVPAPFTDMLFSFDYATKVLTISEAAPPAQPLAVTIAGNLQDELGCPGDWQPDCAATQLAYDADDTVWQGTFNVPAGNWEYKAPLNNSWDENYGANAQRDGPNIPLNLAAPTDVKFYYEHGTHWVTDNVNSRIVTAPGSYQSELGCPGDWDPSCLRSWLQDPDGDGFFTFSALLPGGDYEAKAAINESWDINYGEGGVQNGPNIPFSVPAPFAEVFFTFDTSTNVLSISLGPTAPKGNLAQAKSYWVAADVIATHTGGAGDQFALHYAADGGLGIDENGITGADGALTLSFDPAGLPSEVTDKFPHLAGLAALRIGGGDVGMVPEILKGQVALSIADADGNPVDATSLQIPGVLDDLYTHDGDLGPVFHGGEAVITAWAPTARNVTLRLYDVPDRSSTFVEYPMLWDALAGTWSCAGDSSWNGKFYLFDVEVYVPSTGQVEHNLVTDPYSLSLSMNSLFSQVVDLDDPGLKPAGWDSYLKPALPAPEDIVIYELHVRDFSVYDETVPEAYRGTYKAFTADGADGSNHLEALAGAGLTHLHLLPTFDIASIDEDKSSWQEVDRSLLAAYPPDSTEQQAAVSAVANTDGFNWGYDPFHYTVPEGSYSTDPNGTARIVEYREMIKALNEDGLRVVMDVVYNHTNASGQNDKSVLDKIVPGYYHRLGSTGSIERSTCCENTAAEHAMMEKLMIDSLVTWARDYKVDGFRFDLMGHHPKSTMLKIRAALDSLTPEADGVDGSQIYLYGEGWNFGEVANNARFEQATQANMAGTGIGTFSDRLRDGVRGGNPFSDVREQGFINGLGYDPSAFEVGDGGDDVAELRHRSDWIRVGLAGDLAEFSFIDSGGNLVQAWQVDYFGQQAGYTADPQENITYVAAHDNETLFDATQLKAPVATSIEDRVRIQNLGNSIVMLGQGIPFFHAGQDILRSKSMDRDSYNSGDWFNAVDWSLATSNWGIGLPIADKNQDKWPIMTPLLADPALAPQSADLFHSAEQFIELLQIRKSSKLFRLETADEVKSKVAFLNTGPSQLPGLIVMSLYDDYGDVDLTTEQIIALFNASDEPVAFPFTTDGRAFELHPVQAASIDAVVQTAHFDTGAETFHVPARTTAVFLLPRPIGEQIDVLLDAVDALEADEVLNAGQANSLRAKLLAAQKSAANGRAGPAANQLGAFINEVEAFAAAGVLTAEEGESLIAIAEEILAAIG